MAYRKLGRDSKHRRSMLANLTKAVIMNERIETTEDRAKEVKSIADSLISLAVKEAKNFKEVDQKVVKAKLDGKGNKEQEINENNYSDNSITINCKYRIICCYILFEITRI